MKIAAPRHEKMDALADALQEKLGLDLDLCQSLAVGMMERLWIYTSEFLQQGNIGKLTNARIAKKAGWNTEPDWFVDVLVECRWLDPHPVHRLIVHDWPEHCQDNVHTWLARKLLHFADGTRPKLTRLAKEERARIEESFVRIEEEEAEREARQNAVSAQTIQESALENAPAQFRMDRSGAFDEEITLSEDDFEENPSHSRLEPVENKGFDTPCARCALFARSKSALPSPTQPSQIKYPPLSPHPDGGEGALEIEVGRKLRMDYVWDEWDEIKENLMDRVPGEEVDPLFSVRVAGRQNGTLFLYGCKDPPDRFGPALRSQMARELIPHGIKTIRINPQGGFP